MASSSSSSSAPADQPEPESQGIASRCPSCLGWVSSFIPCFPLQSNSRESTSTVDPCIPDNEASTSTLALMPDNEATTMASSSSSSSAPADKPEPESQGIASRASISTTDNEASTSTSTSSTAFHAIAPPPSTSASKRTQKPLYDVFINHRGPDVKHTLAALLYSMLTGMSLSVFLDSEELQDGDFLPEAIQAAMDGALLHIAIFSKGYAESPWCLAELAFMLKSGAKIVPIFYHVDPSDLRWVEKGNGMYVKAFKDHKRKGRYSQQQLQEWKSALHDVSFYKGQIIKTQQDEMRLLKNIVRCVLKEIKNSMPLVVANHPVGLEEIVQDFKANTLKSVEGDQNAQIVGIWGMGGSGKTTLAKELYNQISSSMDRSSFVFHVRDAATKGLLPDKQKKLLKDLGRQNLEFDNIEEGMRYLSRCLRSNRVLIVLDDVDNVEQLNILLQTKDIFEKGSLIIVTTRAYDVLKSWGISSIYNMRGLDPVYAKKLFCWYAFLKPSPDDGFHKLVEKFLEVCKGLPLSLKVFGAHLRGESRKEYWESQLDKISKILSEDIQKILKISYDSLNKEEKEMFLDTACFFIGQQYEMAIEIWKGMGLSALQNWEMLLNRCLVELDSDNFIIMHDHLRDLGRDIANKQFPCRLWFPQQSIDIQKQVQISFPFQGIIATSNQMEWNHQKAQYTTVKIEEIEEFRIWCSQGNLMVKTSGGIWSLPPSRIGLKYLAISGDYFNQVMGDISKEVIWLRWFQIGQPNVPSKLSMKKLRVLEIFESNNREHHFKELWRSKQAPLQLRQLVISNCYKFQGFPKSIGQLKHLKKIVITAGFNVRSLPDEFCLLQSLEYLALRQCQMPSLPSSFGDLRELRHLDLYFCQMLNRLPDSFKNLKLLEYLNLEGCFKFTFRSGDLNCLENITKLECLRLLGCWELEELPRHITNQASLRELNFEGTSIRELPENVGQLSRLGELRITGVPLTSLPTSLGQLSRLRELSISHVPLTSLPTSLGDLSSLTKLEFSDCDKLERLPDSTGSLSSLTLLSIGGCLELKSLPESLGALSSLASLVIFGCPKLEREGVKSLPKSITQLNHLERLALDGIPINELDLGGSSNLKRIYLEKTQVCRISLSEASCPHLKELGVFNNNHLMEIEALPRTLKTIDLINCEALKSIPSFAGLTSLTKFSLLGCYGIEKIQGLENCTRLEKLFASTRWEVPGIESLEHMQKLKEVVLKANKGTVIERCIQRVQVIIVCSSKNLYLFSSDECALPECCENNMQKWPDREMMICAGAVPDAASLVENILLSRNLVILKSVSNQNMKSGPKSVLKFGVSDGDALIMFCFIVNCVSPEMAVEITLDVYRSHYVKVRKGRWAVVGVVTQRFRDEEGKREGDEFTIGIGVGRGRGGGGEGEVQKGLIVTGPEKTPMTALCSLLPIFS